jgi:hypothetical protein
VFVLAAGVALFNLIAKVCCTPEHLAAVSAIDIDYAYMSDRYIVLFYRYLEGCLPMRLVVRGKRVFSRQQYLLQFCLSRRATLKRDMHALFLIAALLLAVCLHGASAAGAKLPYVLYSHLSAENRVSLARHVALTYTATTALGARAATPLPSLYIKRMRIVVTHSLS